MPPIPKIKPYRNPEYLRFIRTKPSLKSGRYGTELDPIEACHQSWIDGGSMGSKASDFYTIPLLKSEHAREHVLGHESYWDVTELWLAQSMLLYINEFFSRKKQGEKF